jgi:hypothetical protein
MASSWIRELSKTCALLDVSVKQSAVKVGPTIPQIILTLTLSGEVHAQVLLRRFSPGEF